VNTLAKGMINQMLKPHNQIKDNRTGCLQKYGVAGRKRTRKYIILNTDNIQLQTISWGQNRDIPRRISTSSYSWAIKAVEYNRDLEELHHPVTLAEMRTSDAPKQLWKPRQRCFFGHQWAQEAISRWSIHANTIRH
jgi:hypothetical protein